jgi:hypothetical protein
LPSEPANFAAGSPVLAWLNRSDFERARLRWPGFALWRNHEEFLAERDALHVGYLSSGVTAEIQRVPLDAFERWTRLTGAPADLDGLDEFAAHWRWRARHPGTPVVGKFGFADDPERSPPAVAGVQRLLVLPELFVRWRDDLARPKLFPAPGLDVYATHVAECCLPCGRRARRSAATSA